MKCKRLSRAFVQLPSAAIMFKHRALSLGIRTVLAVHNRRRATLRQVFQARAFLRQASPPPINNRPHSHNHRSRRNSSTSRLGHRSPVPIARVEADFGIATWIRRQLHSCFNCGILTLLRVHTVKLHSINASLRAFPWEQMASNSTNNRATVCRSFRRRHTLDSE